ncbi:MAG: DegT/DnrJ/EryC1/StrS family aminotransferase [Pseudomonadota bacterium]
MASRSDEVEILEPIAFIDLKAQQKRIRERIEARLKAVLDHGRYIAGPEIEELEQKLAEKTGAAEVVACASGTDALIIPMMARGLTREDAAFIPAFTYNATANAVLLAGATPVFVDIDPETFNMDPDDLRAKIDEVKAEGRLRPAAICAVDLFGAPADYDAISKIAAEEGMHLFADGAQSFGGKLNDKWVGNLAPITGTSFFPGKALGCYGDGGATFLQSKDDREIMESIRWHGTDPQRRESVRVGMNGRLDTFQAAVVLEKLEIFYDELDERKRVAAIYNERLADYAQMQALPSGAENGYGYYSVCIEHRDAVRAKMGEAAVPTAVYYMQPLHQMAAFKEYAPAEGLEVCESVASRIMSLPMHPYLTDEMAHRVCDAFISAVEATAEPEAA